MAFAYFLLVLAGFFQQTLSSSNKCLSRFQSDRAHFKPCLTNFEHQSLFPCKNRRKLFRHLRGSSFDIHQEINFEALCVWGGKECTFNDMLKFVSQRANDTDTNKYRFGIQGMLSHLPARITPTLRPSVTIYQEMIIVVKSIGANPENTATAIGKVFRAFDMSTWAALVAIVVFLILLSVSMAYVHTGSVTAATVLDNMFGIVDEETYKTQGDNRILRRTTVSLLGCACSIVFILVVLFYEIGVANFIFNESASTLSKPLSKFTNKELESFIALPGSSLERMLVGAVGRKLDENAYPWQHCSNFDECFARLIDPSDSTVYLMTAISDAKYRIKNALACGKATVLDTWSKPELTFQGNQGIPNGWFFSSAIPDEAVRKLNRELLEIKLNGKLQSIYERWVGNDGERCAQKKLSIAVQVMMFPFAFLAGPMVAASLVLLLRLSIIKFRTKG